MAGLAEASSRAAKGLGFPTRTLNVETGCKELAGNHDRFHREAQLFGVPLVIGAFAAATASYWPASCEGFKGWVQHRRANPMASR